MDMTNPSGIRDAFWSSLDETVALAAAEKGVTLVGRGTHFSCYRVPGSRPLPLVVKRAHPAFRDGLADARAEWRRLIARVVTLGLPWVPPMITRVKGDDLFCVMPWCDEGPLPTRDVTDAWLRELQRHGLELRDWPHVRWLGGQPVIADWSDLTTSASRTV